MILNILTWKLKITLDLYQNVWFVLLTTSGVYRN